MQILETRKIPAKTVYTLYVDKVEVDLIKAAMKLYYKDRIKFLDHIKKPVKGDVWVELAKELESSLPDIGE